MKKTIIILTYLIFGAILVYTPLVRPQPSAQELGINCIKGLRAVACTIKNWYNSSTLNYCLLFSKKLAVKGVSSLTRSIRSHPKVYCACAITGLVAAALCSSKKIVFHMLMAGIYSANRHLIRCAIALGGDVNNSFSDICWASPLAQAVHLGNFQIIRYLVEHGATCNDPLTIEDSVIHGNIALTEYLREHGANLYNPHLLFTAVQHNQRAMVAYLIEECHLGVNEIGPNYNTALYYAIINQNIRMCRYLLDHGAKVNVFCQKSGVSDVLSLLQVAIIQNNIEIVRLLVQHGALINQLNKKFDVLATAAANGNIEIVRYLVDQGAEVTDQYNAADWHNREVIDYLWAMSEGVRQQNAARMQERIRLAAEQRKCEAAVEQERARQNAEREEQEVREAQRRLEEERIIISQAKDWIRTHSITVSDLDLQHIKKCSQILGRIINRDKQSQKMTSWRCVCEQISAIMPSEDFKQRFFILDHHCQYKKILSLFHPDKVKMLRPDVAQEAEYIFKIVNEVYNNWVSNPH